MLAVEGDGGARLGAGDPRHGPGIDGSGLSGNGSTRVLRRRRRIDEGADWASRRSKLMAVIADFGSPSEQRRPRDYAAMTTTRLATWARGRTTTMGDGRC
ncbi:hypothetical protein M0R45_006660 [Rubus argutus]|uniref:Uncharacterized protein n=1 Tax=Rubus argutus TaxID=59490 RepID=A0AAW1YRN1_RUBAR